MECRRVAYSAGCLGVVARGRFVPNKNTKCCRDVIKLTLFPARGRQAWCEDLWTRGLGWEEEEELGRGAEVMKRAILYMEIFTISVLYMLLTLSLRPAPMRVITPRYLSAINHDRMMPGGSGGGGGGGGMCSCSILHVRLQGVVRTQNESFSMTSGSANIKYIIIITITIIISSSSSSSSRRRGSHQHHHQQQPRQQSSSLSSSSSPQSSS